MIVGTVSEDLDGHGGEEEEEEDRNRVIKSGSEMREDNYRLKGTKCHSHTG